MQPNAIIAFLKWAAGLISLAGLAYVGERGQDGGFIKDVWAAAKVASPFTAMIALILLFDERKERRQAQKDCNERTIDFIKSTNASSEAFERVSRIFDNLLLAPPKGRKR